MGNYKSAYILYFEDTINYPATLLTIIWKRKKPLGDTMRQFCYCVDLMKDNGIEKLLAQKSNPHLIDKDNFIVWDKSSKHNYFQTRARLL